MKSKIYNEDGSFKRNIAIDAEMLAFANKYGIDSIFEYQQSHKELFQTAQRAIDRIKWYSNQRKDYKIKVSIKAKQLINSNKI